MSRSILDSLPSHIAVLDEEGGILTVNWAWRDFVIPNEANRNVNEGANYFEVYGSAHGEDGSEAPAIVDGIRDVLAGRCDTFDLEYPCHSPRSERWFLTRVTPFHGDGPRRVVVSHENITERKLNELALERYAERLETLHEIEKAILSARSPGEIATVGLEHLAKVIPCWRADVVAFDWDARTLRVIALVGNEFEEIKVGSVVPLARGNPSDLQRLIRGEVVEVGDLIEDAPGAELLAGMARAGLRSYLRIPLMNQGHLVGSLNLSSDRAFAFTPQHVDQARETADQISIAFWQAILFEMVQSSQERLAELSRQLFRAQEDERRRIARELHDEVGQCLAAAKISLDRLSLDPAMRAGVPLLAEATDLIIQILGHVRDLSRLLRPSLLDDLGLSVALRSLVKSLADTAGVEAEVDIGTSYVRLDSEIETACYRIAQEALTNAVKYANSKRLGVSLNLIGNELRMIVTDDGIGFDVVEATTKARLGKSLGLLGLRERATLLGGRAEIHSKPGSGTRVIATFHVPHPSARQDDEGESPPGVTPQLGKKPERIGFSDGN